jgi:hypothetical protein
MSHPQMNEAPGGNRSFKRNHETHLNHSSDFTTHGTSDASIALSDLYANGDKRFVTVVTTPGGCGKVATLDAGNIVFKSAGTGIAGRGRVHYVPTAASLLEVLEGLGPTDYITPDFVPALLDAESFEVVTAAQYSERFGNDTGVPEQTAAGLCVTLNNTEGCWAFGAWRILDRDVDASTPEQYRCNYKEWMQYAERVLPGFLTAPRVFWPSSKSRVAIEGGEARKSLNCHTWVLCTGTEATNALRTRLPIIAAERGVYWSIPRRSRATGEPLPGKPLARTVFDIMIWSIHRQIYAAPPKIESKGLVLLPPAGRAIEGTPLDLEKAIPAPDYASVETYAKETGTKVTRRTGGSFSFSDLTSLNLDNQIELANGEVLTVQQFLWDDRFEFDKKYRCQCIFRDSSSLNGIVRKYKTGKVMHHDNGAGVTYVMPKVDLDFVCDRFTRNKGGNAAEAKTELADCLAQVLDADWRAARNHVSHRTGLPMVQLDTERQAARQRFFDSPEGRAEIAETNRARQEAVDRARSAPVDIASLRSGGDILAQLLANWILLLQSQSTIAGSFFLSNSSYGDGKELRFSSYALPALIEFCKAFPVFVEDPLGEAKPHDVVRVWQSNSAREGARTVTFEPGLPRRLPNADLNLWTGFAFEPAATSEGCELFLQHVREVVAAGDESINRYILGWMATRVQGIYNRKLGKPLPRMVVALVMRSAQGTGKGLFETYFAKLFGNHALCTAKGNGLTGRFNFQFANLALLCADEAFFAGDHKSHDLLKAFQTEATFDFEQKFKDSVSLPNHCATIMSTNKEWAVPADAGDRRMCVFDVSDHRKGDYDYFRKLGEERDGNGPAALMRFLLDYDLSGFNVLEFPRTEALMVQQVRTMSRDDPTIEWLNEALEEGGFEIEEPHGSFGGLQKRFIEWPDDQPIRLSRNGVGKAVRELAAATKKYSPPANMAVGQTLAKAVGAVVGRNLKTTGTGAARANAWELPKLSVARVRFAAYLRTGDCNGPAF